ncbi:ketopantoate reductase family protein [Aquibaculum arenosum]|uniref:2-dehydropantoate 2-reductase n=1 Tax=Aquibaculum arenosum TaxID=3032591 RepID=A0ABT5YMK6_9PROT|nr:2-dehydropantoate 2-reductase [Fodinicurvata sp. CAU 1616]MDF2096078.1 2-dehydropantoate 2-reductase [Fodinicurvata sp. CAU 1616]
MRIAVYGAGAVGSVLAAKLADAGHEVVLIARGQRLAQVRDEGLRLRVEGRESRTRLPVSDDPAQFGPQDTVILALKAHSLPAVVEGVGALCGPETVLLAAQNGLPWWYNHGVGGAWEGQILESVDPGGVLWSGLSPERVLGCVLYIAAAVEPSGLVDVTQIGNYLIGEPNGRDSKRGLRLVEAFTTAGLPAELNPRIRDAIWVKLWGNLSLNLAAVLTGGTVRQMTERPEVATLLQQMMREAQQVGEALGVQFGMSVEERFAIACKLGDFKPSSLQDLEAGRRIEVEALLGVVVELGRRLSLDTPTLETVLALARLRADLAIS